LIAQFEQGPAMLAAEHHMPAALAMALAITLTGFVGGLAMSAIKRERGVKDWGDVIKGHGGMLDRLDSVCFSAPVFFHLVRCFYAT
jgi:phosphatidate cytidylyltransferase